MLKSFEILLLIVLSVHIKLLAVILGILYAAPVEIFFFNQTQIRKIFMNARRILILRMVCFYGRSWPASALLAYVVTIGV